MRRPSTIAHRGASGYEYENSLAAFRRAVMLDADGVELDVHMTRDGAIVIHHDAELPGLGPISAADCAAVRQVRLPNGERIPLLAEALELIGDRDVWIELKALDAAWDRTLLAVLDAGPTPERYAVHSVEHTIVGRLGRLRPALKRGILLSSAAADPVQAMAEVGASMLWPECRLIDAELVRAVHAAGAGVIAWTVNDLNELRRLIQLGVDGLCGNYPDRIRVAIGMESEAPSLGF